MRYLSTAICLATSVLLTSVSWAQDGGDRRAEMRKKIMEEFDADGDGQLSEEERANARTEMRKRRDGGAAEGDRPRGRRQGGAEGQRGGPGAPPEPGALFDKYDVNKDSQLSQDEFMKLNEAVRGQRGQRGPRGREGAGPGGPRGDRPAKGEGRRRPRAEGEDRPERPARPPHMNDEDGEQDSAKRKGNKAGKKGRAGRGRGEGGPQGGPPSPEAIFGRLDSNDDNQLSREEFMKLADRMLQRGQGRGGEGRGGPGGRGRRGGPGGEQGKERPRRPARPQFDDDNV